MRRREQVELAAVAAASLLAATVAPRVFAAGSLALIASALLLGQGLLRDLWLLTQPAAAAPRCSRASICLESAAGLSGVLAGAVLSLAGLGGSLPLARWQCGALVLAVGLAGFFLKDVVLDLQGRRLRVERDHRNLIVW